MNIKKAFYFLVLMTMPVILFAHENRPLYLKIVMHDSMYSFDLNVPNTVHSKNFPIVSLDSIYVNKDINWLINSSGFRQKWNIRLPFNTLEGIRIKIEYPVYNPVISTIISVKLGHIEEQIYIIPPNKDSIVFPEKQNKTQVIAQYSLLGIKHIWSGIDHLLFLVCLVIITNFSKELLITITGFTIAHSITLILSSLQIIQLHSGAIEASIALSIIFLCYEIIHHHATKKSLTYNYPILVSSSFGLLHGLGFATVLSQIGLPENHKIKALIFFNIGVEIGQILFIIALFFMFLIFKRIIKTIPIAEKQKISIIAFRATVYFIGILASYWLFVRIT